MATPLVLPRPGTQYPTLDPIPAPTEAEFTSTFGALLPRAQYVTTQHGKAAYYVFPPSASSSAQEQPKSTTTGPSRVLLVHGVQTPALGLLPLTNFLRARFPAAQFALFDLWGHGLSETPVEPHEGGLFGGLVSAVLAALGWEKEEEQEKLALVGYSFGSVVSMRWLSDMHAPAGGRLHSLTLVAPAGLLRRGWFTAEQQGWLSGDCAAQDEGKAAAFVVRALEGGELTVPADWEERVARGEVVAQAVKKWQMERHAGHYASVVGVFRDGGVFEDQELFGRARKTGVPVLVVLGETDEMSTEEEVRGLGFEVRVVEGAGHAVVRERAGEVAERIGEFWGTL